MSDSKPWKGSRARCLHATDGPPDAVAEWLTTLLEPHARVYPSHIWAPRPRSPDEAMLGYRSNFLTREQDDEIVRWWLEHRRGQPKLPTWDIVSQASFGERAGLVLVEAKAHRAEFEHGDAKRLNADASDASHENHQRIGACLDEASTNLAARVPGRWRLNHTTHYQLSNRFAFAWKLASMGIPVALVYLGCVDAAEWPGRFTSAEWRELVRRHSANVVPAAAWEHAIDVGGTPLLPLVRSARIDLPPT